MKAMKLISKLGYEEDNSSTIPAEFKDFFFAPFDYGDLITINDPSHLAPKMFWKLLNTPPLIGRYRASATDIRLVIDANRKDLRFGTSVLTDVVDAMNYSKVALVCCKEFIDLFTSQEQLATKFYLTLIQYVIEAFIDRTTSPTERIYKAWFVVFFCREWKTFVEMNEKTRLLDDFITPNALNCIELNAHNLIKFLLVCRETCQPEMFLPHLLGSQDCEAFFRNLRSMGSTNYTVVNFTMNELLHKIRRVMKMSHLESMYNIVRPGAVIKSNKTFVPDHLPSNEEIFNIISDVWVQVKKDLQQLGKAKLINHSNKDLN